jgi:cytochrome c oxidase subunit 1
MAGRPRRYFEAPIPGSAFNRLQALMPLEKFISIAAFVTAAAQIIFVINLFWSMKKGKKAPMNPWESTTLEWTIPSPPPHDNFGGQIPVVNHGPYEYAVPGAERDYIMQTDPVTAHAH